jgi:hypothetical protein
MDVLLRNAVEGVVQMIGVDASYVICELESGA